MKVVSIAICLMFLVGCSGVKPTVTSVPEVHQVTMLEKNSKWLPTHHITTQDFVFKDGKICTINSLADAYCTPPKNGFSLKTAVTANELVKNTIDSPLGFENNKRKLKYLLNIEKDTALEYSLGRRSLTVTAKHKF